MLIKTIGLILVTISLFITAIGQSPVSDKVAVRPPPSGSSRSERVRDIPFPNGVELQFLIKELAKDLDLNVIFDSLTFRPGGNRKTNIELKNVTSWEAINYILMQERLIFEEVGPKTILIMGRDVALSIPQFGVGIYPVSDQLAQYFGVERGLLITNVRPGSPAAKAGLKAGDVIWEVAGEQTRSTLAVINWLDNKKENEVTLKVVRDRKDLSVTLILEGGTK